MKKIKDNKDTLLARIEENRRWVYAFGYEPDQQRFFEMRIKFLEKRLKRFTEDEELLNG